MLSSPTQIFTSVLLICRTIATLRSPAILDGVITKGIQNNTTLSLTMYLKFYHLNQMSLYSLRVRLTRLLPIALMSSLQIADRFLTSVCKVEGLGECQTHKLFKRNKIKRHLNAQPNITTVLSMCKYLGETKLQSHGFFKVLCNTV